MDRHVGQMLVMNSSGGIYIERHLDDGPFEDEHRFLTESGSVGLVIDSKLYGGDREDYRWYKVVLESGVGWVPGVYCDFVTQ